jgi:neutral ceramidase
VTDGLTECPPFLATLDAYIEKYSSLVPFLADSPTGTPASDAAPPELQSSALSLQTGVVFDAAPIGKSFGQVLIDVAKTAYKAGDTVIAQFVGANPRVRWLTLTPPVLVLVWLIAFGAQNNLRLEGTFLSVDHLAGSVWTPVRSDSHPSTIYQWTRASTILGTSNVNISWTIEPNTPGSPFLCPFSSFTRGF